MTRAFLKTCALVIALVAVAAPLSAQGKGKGKGHGRERAESAAPAYRASSDEVRTIRDYFANTSNLPPGLAKRGSLPPGFARQLRRNGTLPPGLAKRATPLPGDLEGRLPPLPEGRRRVIIGNRVLVVDNGTQRILDVIDVLTRR